MKTKEEQQRDQAFKEYLAIYDLAYKKFRAIIDKAWKECQEKCEVINEQEGEEEEDIKIIDGKKYKLIKKL